MKAGTKGEPMTSHREDQAFGKAMAESLDFGNLLADAQTWIKDNLSPEQVFDEDQLNNWAADNDFVKKE
jgi:hypothetical protein